MMLTTNLMLFLYFFYIFDHLKKIKKIADRINGILPKLTENIEPSTKLIVYQYNAHTGTCTLFGKVRRCQTRCTDIRSHGHSFPRDFWQGRTFVATSNDHPGHSWPHQMTTRTFVATSNDHPGHSCSHRSSLMQTNLYNLLFDELIPRWVKETWQCVCRNICLMVRIWVLI